MPFFRLLFLCCLLIVISCSKAPVQQPMLSQDAHVDLAKTLYVEALKLEWAGYDSLATLYIIEAAKLDTSSSYLPSRVLSKITKSPDSIQSLFWANETWKRSVGSNAQAAYYLGQWHRRNNRLDSAIFYLDSGWRLSNRTPITILQELALCYKITDRIDKAMDVWEQIAILTNYPNPVIERYLQLAQGEELEKKALKFLANAWTITGDPQIGRNYAQWLSTQDQDSLALITLAELIHIDTANQKSYQGARAMLFERMKSYDSAYVAQVAYYDNHDLDAPSNLARLALRANRPKEAIAWLNKIPADSQSIQSYALYSAAYTDMDSFDMAIFYMEKVQKLAPENDRVKSELWDLKSQSPKHQKTLALDFENHLKKNPTDTKVHYAKAQLHVRMGNSAKRSGKPYEEHFNKAIAEYTALSMLDPDKSMLFLDYADALINVNRIHDAKAQLERAYKLDTNNAYTQNAYGFFLVDREFDIEKGGRLIQLAMQAYPLSTATQDSYAWYLFKIGKTQDALELLKKTIQFLNPDAPENWEYQYHIAEIYLKLNNSTLAQTHAKNALRLHPYRPEVLELIKRIKSISKSY